MKLDLAECEIRTPGGDDLLALYRMLMDVFPVDRPVFTEMIETGKRFYTWTPYALYQGAELLGSVSLMPVGIWLGGQAVEVVGIASVATRKEHRRKGVARHLMRHGLGIVDERSAPAVLLTDLPAVYEGLGFKAVKQTYPAACVPEMDFGTGGFDCELVDCLDQGRLERMASIYADEYPNYDGKVFRDRDYWRLYQMLFDLYPKSRILLCTSHERTLGYARIEVEGDRLLLSELCARADAVEATALLGFVADCARQVGVGLVTLALSPDHFASETLQRHGVLLQPEPAGAHRETFMVRPRPGEPPGPLERLHWSLADKF